MKKNLLILLISFISINIFSQNICIDVQSLKDDSDNENLKGNADIKIS